MDESERRRVLAASDAWRWVPPGAEELEIHGIDIIDYPAWASMGFHARPLQVEAEVESVVDDVVDLASRRGRSAVRWWISPTTTPPELAEVLVARHAEVTEELGIFGYDLTRGLPDFGPLTGLAGRLVTDAATLEDAERVAAIGWSSEPSSGERRASQLAELDVPIAERSSFRAVCYGADGAGLSTGGCEVADGVARLWGACTVPSERGRGAYRMVLKVRLEEAVRHAAELALVQARVGTSGPIVERVGFTPYGVGRIYSLPVGQ